jgi:hypothetical protein
MVKRRKFVIGLGALVAGSGAALGTGASVSSTMDRDANVNVVNDSNGLIALKDETGSDVVQTQNGELKIDFTGDTGSAGVNVDSRYQIGEFSAVDKAFIPDVESNGGPLLEGTTSNVMSNPAFTIVNNDTVNHVVNVSYDISSSDIGGARVLWQFEDEARQYHIDLTGTTTSGSVSIDGKGADPAPEPGDSVGAALFIDTRGYSGDAEDLDLSGTLTVSV